MKPTHGFVGGKHNQTGGAAPLPCMDCHTVPGNLRWRCCSRLGHDTEASKGAARGQPHGAEVSESGSGIGSGDVRCSEGSVAVAAGGGRMSHATWSTEGQTRFA